MLTNENTKYYCHWCRIKFSTIDSNGVAVCPICKKKREDGLNQIEENKYKCIKCGCRFTHVKQIKPDLKCPNECMTGGRK